jgi:Family of unknown function (DUF6173)
MPQPPDFSHLIPKVPDLSTVIPKPIDFSALIPRQIEMPRIQPSPIVTAVQQNYASEFYKRLVEWIGEFDASLSREFEVGVRLVSFGQALVFRLEDLGYWNPSLISFKGHTDDGAPVELIQHVSQISVLLMRIPREDPEAPKRPIGFQVPEE